MSNPVLLNCSLNQTQNNSDFVGNYFQLFSFIVSNFKSVSSNNFQRAFQQQDNQPAAVPCNLYSILTAEALCLGFYVFALTSRSSFQLVSNIYLLLNY
jgi:hypothetical protein